MPLQWTDPQSHSSVATLSNLWEKDLFDDSTASVMLAQELGHNKIFEFVQLAELLAFTRAYPSFESIGLNVEPLHSSRQEHHTGGPGRIGNSC